MQSNRIAYATFVVLLAISACVAVSTATSSGTFKPFVRSRYSVRWRQTATQSPVLDNKTITTDTSIGMNSNGLIYDSESATTITMNVTSDMKDEEIIFSAAAATIIQPKGKGHTEIVTSTIQPKQKSSTPPMDYDYYNGGEADDINNK